MPADAETAELLLLHGWCFGAGVWQPVIDHLETGVRVNAVSLPGYAGAAMDNTATMEEIVEQLAAALSSPAVVIGWSLGGLLAVELAWRYPGRIRALGLIAALPCFSRQPGWAAGWERRAIAAVHDRLQRDAAATSRYMAALAARGDADSNSVRGQLQTCALIRRDTLERDLDYLMAADRRREFAGLDVPVHAWFGERDALIGNDCAAAVRALQPAARIHELPYAGHAPLLSRPGDIARDLEPLL
ncbi:MAG: alpha/beta fold hydrolase [Gammaproteobacteria bacterium]|nr:alpha/beta fold hydrolase [Gammaproteobacteria bacterium]